MQAKRIIIFLLVGAHLLLPEPQEGAVIATSGEVAGWILGPQHQLPAPIVLGRKEPGREL